MASPERPLQGCSLPKLATGYTFKDYLLNRRLTMAKELLKKGNPRVSDVTEQVGYTAKHSSELFKKSFSVPPKKSQR